MRIGKGVRNHAGEPERSVDFIIWNIYIKRKGVCRLFTKKLKYRLFSFRITAGLKNRGCSFGMERVIITDVPGCIAVYDFRKAVIPFGTFQKVSKRKHDFIKNVAFSLAIPFGMCYTFKDFEPLT